MKAHQPVDVITLTKKSHHVLSATSRFKTKASFGQASCVEFQTGYQVPRLDVRLKTCFGFSKRKILFYLGGAGIVVRRRRRSTPQGRRRLPVLLGGQLLSACGFSLRCSTRLASFELAASACFHRSCVRGSHLQELGTFDQAQLAHGRLPKAPGQKSFFRQSPRAQITF